MIIYNQTMFDEQGLNTPTFYANRGDWTMERFLSSARELTVLDAAGEIQTAGLSSWATMPFIWNNDTSFLNFEHGLFSSNIDDVKLINALELYHEMANANIWSGGESTFMQGQSAMYVERTFFVTNLQRQVQAGTLDFEYGIAPIPAGPDNTEMRTPVESDGYGIGRGSRRPRAAGLFIDNLVTVLYQRGMDVRAELWTDDIADKVISWIENGIFSSVLDSPLLGDGTADELLYEIAYGARGEIASSLEARRNEFNAMLDRINNPPEIELAAEFVPIETVTFDGSMAPFSIAENAVEGLSYAFVDDPDFEGQALQIQFEGSRSDVLQADHAFVGMRRYEVTFDVKVLSEINEFSGFIAVLVNPNADEEENERREVASREVRLEPGTEGDVQTVSVVHEGWNIVSEELVLVLRFDRVNDVVIDNLRVVEFDPYA